MRMSLASASASPPPAAGPLTAAITGWGSERSFGTSAAMCFCDGHARLHGADVLTAGRDAVAAEVEPGAEPAAGAGEDHGPARAVARRSPSSASWSSVISSTFIALSLAGRSRVTTVIPSSG